MNELYDKITLTDDENLIPDEKEINKIFGNWSSIDDENDPKIYKELINKN